VTITAQSVPDYTFQKWTENGNQVSTSALYSFIVGGARNLVAEYQAKITGIIVKISPPAQNASKGQNFVVNISVDPNNTQIYSGQYDLYFDPANLEVINQQQGMFLRQDGASSLIVQNNWNNTVGVASYGETRIDVANGAAQQGIMTSITFHVKNTASEGNHNLYLENVVLSDPKANQIDGISVFNGNIYISTNVQPAAIVSTNHTVNNAGSKTFFDGSASNDPDGYISAYEWNFGDDMIGNGSKIFHIYKSYNWNGTAYLPFIVAFSVTDNNGATKSINFNIQVYIAGDGNGDGKVNILDAALVGICWNSYYGMQSYDDRADLNNDGLVNIIDASNIGLNWNKHA
jgi:hypothetical protein